ncbi:hypothetical protein NOC27_2552 [Nitrosococcus oceani AFC27]|nr:hypothetical protein NOC27_2552 [Nitrosococcus oceani AFC27]
MEVITTGHSAYRLQYACGLGLQIPPPDPETRRLCLPS